MNFKLKATGILPPFESDDELTGYMHPKYAESLAEFGKPYRLSECRGWILERQIPGFTDRDAMGCYPLFGCRDWSMLQVDLEGVGPELVSLSLVTDPFGNYDEVYLQQCFKHVVFPFKEHYVIDLKQSRDTFVSSHHRRNVRKALKVVCVERCDEPTEYLDEWTCLYDNLTDKHHITGISAFSRDTFAKQLQTPGIVVLRASYNGITIGMLLWYIQNNIGYYHLGAFNDAGYKLQASFALFWYAIEYFADHKLKWLNLGAGAGVKNSNGEDGLSRFKRGWSTETRIAYFCGRIFNQARYSEITDAKGLVGANYFPAYRKDEFQ